MSSVMITSTASSHPIANMVEIPLTKKVSKKVSKKVETPIVAVVDEVLKVETPFVEKKENEDENKDENEDEKKDEKKEKKAVLPAKLFKNMAFGYWLLLRLKEDNVVDEDVYNKAFADYLKPFASTAVQTSLYESFECDLKMISKDLKKMVRDHHKPPRVKKEKKEKKEKVKKVDDNDASTDLVSRIVEAALTSIEPVKPKRKYNRKKTVDDEIIKKTVNEVDDEIIKKTGEEVLDEVLKELTEEVLDVEEEVEEDTEVQPFTFNDGFSCLVDTKELSLYDKVSHEPITSHTLERISLPDNKLMLIDHNKFAYFHF
jgi:hypothetical protein